MTNNLRNQATELAKRHYRTIGFRDETTDGEPIYVAINPELEGCVAQGETMDEAYRNLAEVRLDCIQHLLEHGLSIPEPQFIHEQITSVFLDDDAEDEITPVSGLEEILQQVTLKT